jgi:flavin reductase (DIM6/NTAB) family NADH-FMN oxidoreductase RutF
MDAAMLRRVFGCFPSGVTAVCALVDGVPAGMAASAFTPVSLDPPLVSLCVQNSSTTWPRLRGADRLGISVLAESHDVVGRQLSLRTGDRFAGLDVRTTAAGALLVGGAAAWLECTVEAELPAGDHVIALLRIHALDGTPDVAPLVFHGSRFRRLVA